MGEGTAAVPAAAPRWAAAPRRFRILLHEGNCGRLFSRGIECYRHARRAEALVSRRVCRRNIITREGPVESFRISVRAGSAWAALLALTALSGSAYGETPDISGTYWATEYRAKIQLVGGGDLPLTSSRQGGL